MGFLANWNASKEKKHIFPPFQEFRYECNLLRKENSVHASDFAAERVFSKLIFEFGEETWGF